MTLTSKVIMAGVVLAVSAASASAQSPVAVGRGSYAEYTPLAKSRSSEHGGDQSRYMQYRTLNIREQAGQPIPTNDWWTNLINGDDHHSGRELTGHLWAYPQYVQGMRYGVDIHYPKYWIDNGTEMKAQSRLTVRADAFAPTRPMAETWSDWTMSFSEQDGDRRMLTTLAHGVPFTWIELTDIAPVISVHRTGNDGRDNKLSGATSVVFTDAAGTTLSGERSLSQFVVSIAGDASSDLYGIYLPPNTAVTFADGEARVAETDFVVVALLQQASDLTYFSTYAYSKPTATRVSWDYAQASGRLTTHWRVEATDLRTGAATGNVLQGFIPHHYRNGAVPGFAFNGRRYRTPRGMLKLAEGADLSVGYTFSGMLPWYALPADLTGDNAFDADRMRQMVATYARSGTFGGDTYWGGKGLTQMALYMTFAREMGEEELFRQCHDRLRDALEDWLTYTPGEQNFFFARDSRYGGLIGYDTSYDSDTYNDHHFHYGYFTLAGALLAMVDDDFRTHYGDMLRLIARDYNNYRRDSWACFLRMMDPWAGHCYAGGLGDGGGNGQESTSESMQAWGGMYLLGVALGDNELRDAGIFGWVSESRATAEYWFDRHGEAIGADFHTTAPDYEADDIDGLYNIDYTKFVHTRDGVADYTQPWSSNLTSHGIGWWTWFGGDPVFMQGIQWMPISPALDYLGEDKAFAAWDYDRLMALKEHVGWEDYSGTQPWLGNSDWGNVVLSYRQWSDAADAARIFDEGWQKGWGTMTTSNTNGITYFTTHSHRTYGDIVWDVTADIPTARVYDKGGVRTHIAYNPTDAPLTVHYADGQTLTVPARQLKVEGVESTACDYIYPVDDSEPDLRERLVMRNLALGRPCSDSSHENAGSVASNATDGDLATRWGSEHHDGEWLQVDLGEEAAIYKVRIRWEAAYAATYSIELRSTADGEPTHVATGAGKASEWTELTLGDQRGRYLRIVGTQRGTQYGISLYELEVYGRAASATDADLMGVEIRSEAAVLTEGRPTQLTVEGYDYGGNARDVAATWHTTDGTITPSGLFTPGRYGMVTMAATVGTMTASRELPVEESLRLTTLDFILDGDAVIGHTVGFEATGRDQFGAPVETTALSFALREVIDGDETETANAILDPAAGTFTALRAGDYVVIVQAGGLTQRFTIRGIGPRGVSYDELPPLAMPDVSATLPLFDGQAESDMNFTYNGASVRGSEAFPVKTTDGGETKALFVSQLGTFGFGPLADLDLEGYNMLHADIFVADDAPTFSFHIEGQPANAEYAKTLVAGQWNAIDVPITNTTANWLFLAFSDYQPGTNEALVANVFFYRATGDRVFVGDPDANGLVRVTSFGSGITDANVAQFLADVAALPSAAAAIDLSTIELHNTAPMNIVTANPNAIILLLGDGGDDNASSAQTAHIANTRNLAYNAGGWILPLRDTGYRVVFEDGYPVFTMNFGRCTTLTYSRTLASGAFATVCLPRDVTLPVGISAYTLAVATDGIEFARTGGNTLEAYTPYLLHNTAATALTLTIEAAQGNMELARGGDALRTQADGVSFVGNFRHMRVAGTEGYAAFRSNGALAWLSNAGTTVGAFRAYLAGITDEQMQAGVKVDGQTMTGIADIEETKEVSSQAAGSRLPGQCYDLSGRRVTGAAANTIYIQYGRKVLVK